MSEAQNPTQIIIEPFTTSNFDDDDEPDYAEVADIAPDLPKKDYDKVVVSPPLRTPITYQETAYFMSYEHHNFEVIPFKFEKFI